MSSNFCVCCGDEIPEGRHVCPLCERDSTKTNQTRRYEKLNLDYVKAAEADIRNLPFLKKSIVTLEKRRDFILSKEGGKTPAVPDFKDPYMPERKINESLNETLALAEISAEIISAKHEVEMIEATLKELSKEEREVLIMFFQKGYNANQIGEALFYDSEKTVYRIRNQGLYHYCLSYYGVSWVKK